MPFPVIFLDIDGVLNSDSHDYLGENWPECCYDPNMCAKLRYVLDQTGAKIVLSSTWREEDYLWQRMPVIFAEWGVGHAPIDKTTSDNLVLPRKLSDYTWSERNRAAQILKWVDENKPTTWIAIDDLALTLPDEHFVRTHPNMGLTKEKAQEALDKLTKGE